MSDEHIIEYAVRNWIDSDKAIYLINAQKINRESQTLTYNDGLQCAINIIRDLLVDAENDLQTWKLLEKFDSIPESGIYYCSFCGKDVVTCHIDNYKYCYQCGSRMKVTGEENDN